MRKIARITAVILMICLLTGCAADTIYIQTGTPSTTAVPDTRGSSAPESTEDTTVLPDDSLVWIPTNGGKKYHKTPTCSSMQSPKQVTQEEAEKQGFSPCKRCYK